MSMTGDTWGGGAEVAVEVLLFFLATPGLSGILEIGGDLNSGGIGGIPPIGILNTKDNGELLCGFYWYFTLQYLPTRVGHLLVHAIIKKARTSHLMHLHWRHGLLPILARVEHIRVPHPWHAEIKNN